MADMIDEEMDDMTNEEMEEPDMTDEEIKRSKLLNACDKEPPDKELVKRVADFIGMPPRAKTYYMIRLEMPEVDEDELERVLDLLYNHKKIDMLNGWIHGVNYIDTSKWTKDDWDWIYGTGHYAQ